MLCCDVMCCDVVYACNGSLAQPIAGVGVYPRSEARIRGSVWERGGIFRQLNFRGKYISLKEYLRFRSKSKVKIKFAKMNTRQAYLYHKLWGKCLFKKKSLIIIPYLYLKTKEIKFLLTFDSVAYSISN